MLKHSKPWMEDTKLLSALRLLDTSYNVRCIDSVVYCLGRATAYCHDQGICLPSKRAGVYSIRSSPRISFRKGTFSSGFVLSDCFDMEKFCHNWMRRESEYRLAAGLEMVSSVLSGSKAIAHFGEESSNVAAFEASQVRDG
jgi:hypothetical protein